MKAAPLKPTRRGRIDWMEVHRRLARSEALLEEALSPDARRVEEILEQRAARLARRSEGKDSESAALRVMVVRLGEERYAIETKDLAETAPLTGCIPVPGSAPHILGVVQLRGELCAVASLCRLIGVPETGDGGSGVVVVLRSAAARIGLRVDRVDELREIRPEELVPAAGGRHLRGLIGNLMLLDVPGLAKEIYTNGESME